MKQKFAAVNVLKLCGMIYIYIYKMHTAPCVAL